jgi:hypothetical protein
MDTTIANAFIDIDQIAEHPHLYTRAAFNKVAFVATHSDTFAQAVALIQRDGDWVEADAPFAPAHVETLDWVPQKGVGVRLREATYMVEGFRTYGEVFRPLEIEIDHDAETIRVR